MSSADRWRALQEALAVSKPKCEDDSRFTSETSEHDAILRKICAGCPVLDQCADYARNAPRNGTWGFFGGVVRRTQPQVRERRSALMRRGAVSQIHEYGTGCASGEDDSGLSSIHVQKVVSITCLKIM